MDYEDGKVETFASEAMINEPYFLAIRGYWCLDHQKFEVGCSLTRFDEMRCSRWNTGRCILSHATIGLARLAVQSAEHLVLAPEMVGGRKIPGNCAANAINHTRYQTADGRVHTDRYPSRNPVNGMPVWAVYVYVTVLAYNLAHRLALP